MKKERKNGSDDAPKPKGLAEGHVRDGDIMILEGRHPVTGNAIQVPLAAYCSDGGDVPAALRLSPKQFAFVVGVLEAARDELRLAQHEEYCVEEDLYLETRQALEETAKKVTETEIKTIVKAHPRMRQAYRSRMEAESRYKRAEAAKEILIERKRDLHAWARYRIAEMSVMAGTEED